MSNFSRLANLLVLLIALSQTACTAQRVQYMQLFYYGPLATANSPVLRFSPAFKGKTLVYLKKQDEYMKQMDPFAITSRAEVISSGTSEATVTTSEGTYIGGKLQTEVQLKQLREKASAESQAQIKKYMDMVNNHMDNVATELSEALNSAADDGWEVVEMTSLEKNGIVYLLRKAK